MEIFYRIDWCYIVTGLGKSILLMLALGLLFDRIRKLIIEPMFNYVLNTWGKWSLLWSEAHLETADQLLQMDLHNSQTTKVGNSDVAIVQDDSAVKKQPVNEFKKDKQISHQLNEFNESNAETSNRAKDLNKKLMQDSVDQRVELLNTIKSLCKRTKRVEKLEKALRDTSEKQVTPAEQQATSILKSTHELNPESADSKITEKTKKRPVLRQSTIKSQSDEEPEKSNVEKRVSVADSLHLSTISEISADNYSSKSTIEKLERITESIDEIHGKVQSDIEQLAHKLLGMFNEWEETKVTRERHHQLAEDLNRIERMLLAGIEKVQNLQCMVDGNRPAENEQTDASDSSIHRQQIIYVEEKLKKLREQNSKLLEEKAQLVSKLAEAEVRELKLSRDYWKLRLLNDDRQRQQKQEERVVPAPVTASAVSPRNNNRLSSSYQPNQQQQQQRARGLDEWVLGHAQGEAARQHQMRRFEVDSSRSARAHTRLHLHVRSLGNSSLSNSEGRPRTPRQRRSIRSRLSANPY